MFVKFKIYNTRLLYVKKNIEIYKIIVFWNEWVKVAYPNTLIQRRRISISLAFFLNISLNIYFQLMDGDPISLLDLFYNICWNMNKKLDEF